MSIFDNIARYNNLATIGKANEAARAATPGALYAQIEMLSKAFQAAGMPPGLIRTYAAALAMLESDWFTSNVANTDNNYSGIKYVKQAGATQGLPSPEGNHYAHFATFQDWAKDYVRVLSLNTGKTGRPIDATTAQQFLDRLKANHYFTDPNYYTKYNAALKKVGEALRWMQGQEQQYKDAAAKGQDTFTYTPGPGLTSNTEFNFDRWLNNVESWAKDNPVKMAGIGLSVALVLNRLFSK